jgi:hypothetical protein
MSTNFEANKNVLKQCVARLIGDVVANRPKKLTDVGRSVNVLRAASFLEF